MLNVTKSVKNYLFVEAEIYGKNCFYIGKLKKILYSNQYSSCTIIIIPSQTEKRKTNVEISFSMFMIIYETKYWR